MIDDRATLPLLYGVMVENAFVDLRTLFDWFEARPKTLPRHILRVTERLGERSVPMLSRELCGEDDARRDAARAALVKLAADPNTRPRVIRALRVIVENGRTDRSKLAALGVLSELGDRTTARFADPVAVQRSSAKAFAAALNTPVDIATAAELLVAQLPSDAILRFLAAMVQTAPDSAAHLARELCCRHDVAPTLREQIVEVVPRVAVAYSSARTPSRPTHVAVLVRDDAADITADITADIAQPTAGNRVVVIATRKVAGQRRWRRWAVLIGSLGYVDDCIHEPASEDADAGDLIERLVSAGFRKLTTETARAHAIVAEAARRTIARKTPTPTLPSPYYVGRDLLDLDDAHLIRAPIHPTSATLGRAVERIAAGDIPTARELLAGCDSENADAAAAIGASLLIEGQYQDAVGPLRRAISLEPTWPLHHWNISVALYQLHDLAGCHQALQQFLATSAAPSGLNADPEQVGRMSRAKKLLALLDRATSSPPKRSANRALLD